MEENNLFYFGRPHNASYELEDTKYYKAHKNLNRFREAGGYDAGHDIDYFYYELERREKYNVGDEIYFKNKEEAAWFRFVPPTGNMMYCMPIVGTDARIGGPGYIPTWRLFLDPKHLASATEAARRGFIASGIGSGAEAWADSNFGISNKIDYAWEKAKQIFDNINCRKSIKG